jgi:hypothetical protein
MAQWSLQPLGSQPFRVQQQRPSRRTLGMLSYRWPWEQCIRQLFREQCIRQLVREQCVRRPRQQWVRQRRGGAMRQQAGGSAHSLEGPPQIMQHQQSRWLGHPHSVDSHRVPLPQRSRAPSSAPRGSFCSSTSFPSCIAADIVAPVDFEDPGASWQYVET